MQSIFIVEDDEDIRELVIYALKSGGYDAYGFETGAAFFNFLKTKQPNLILLDIILPESDGISILKTLKANKKYSHLPVIMLTAKGSEVDKVKGLDLGADDYVTKPFGVTELLSRVRAVLRRAGVPSVKSVRFEYKSIVMDNERHTVSANGNSVTLTFKEYELLYFFLSNCEIVLSRDKIMEVVWGYDFEGESRTVDMHIKSLRQKLGEAGQLIKTVRNVGYKLS
ncbi:MAG: response regulator transcription factor [Clostridiales bacterium]|nr:response regulator transcription factor [Clostridiales bacterium]